MNCKDLESLEPLYTTGDLDPKTMADVDLHISECPDCFLRWKERNHMDALLRDAVMAEPVDATPVNDKSGNERPYLSSGMKRLH